MGLFPKKNSYQHHIKSQLYQREKIIFHKDKLIYTQSLKFYMNKFTEFRSDFYSLK